MITERHLAPAITIIHRDGTQQIYQGWHIASITYTSTREVMTVSVERFTQELPCTTYHPTLLTITKT